MGLPRWRRGRRWIRATMTAASRIMAPTYPGIFIALGLVFLGQAPSRTNGDSFAVARMIPEYLHLPGSPIKVWGLVFLAIGLLEATSLAAMQASRPRIAARGRTIFVAGLVAGAGLSAFWFVVLYAAARNSELVSYSSCLWPLLGAFAHAASARSLAWHEGEAP